MACQYFWERQNYVFDPFVWGQQSKRQQDRFALGAVLVLEVIRVEEGKIRHPVRDHVDLAPRNGIDPAEKTSRLFAHHDEPVRKLGYLFQDKSLLRVRFAQHCVQRRHQRHLQPSQQDENVAPCGSSEDSIFKLQADQVVAIEVKKVGGALIGRAVLLVEFQSHLFRVLVARARIVDRDRK
jgi:hypothetical protein